MRSQRRTVLLMIILGLALAWAGLRVAPRAHVENPRPTVDYRPHALPELLSVTGADGRAGATRRDPFRWPPTPAPTLTPTATRTPEATPTNRIVRTPRPRYTGEYLGYLGPPHDPWAVFRTNRVIEIARRGDRLADGARVVGFDHEGVRLDVGARTTPQWVPISPR